MLHKHQKAPCCIIRGKTSNKEGLSVAEKKPDTFRVMLSRFSSWPGVVNVAVFARQWWGLSSSTEHHMVQRERARGARALLSVWINRFFNYLIGLRPWNIKTLRIWLIGSPPMTLAEEPRRTGWPSKVGMWLHATQLTCQLAYAILTAASPLWKGC